MRNPEQFGFVLWRCSVGFFLKIETVGSSATSEKFYQSAARPRKNYLHRDTLRVRYFLHLNLTIKFL